MQAAEVDPGVHLVGVEGEGAAVRLARVFGIALVELAAEPVPVVGTHADLEGGVGRLGPLTEIDRLPTRLVHEVEQPLTRLGIPDLALAPGHDLAPVRVETHPGQRLIVGDLLP
jgi:hypothetical protein